MTRIKRYAARPWQETCKIGYSPAKPRTVVRKPSYKAIKGHPFWDRPTKGGWLVRVDDATMYVGVETPCFNVAKQGAHGERLYLLRVSCVSHWKPVLAAATTFTMDDARRHAEAAETPAGGFVWIGYGETPVELKGDLQ